MLTNNVNMLRLIGTEITIVKYAYFAIAENIISVISLISSKDFMIVNLSLNALR